MSELPGAATGVDLEVAVEAFTDLLAQHAKALVLTGAGISTDSGIPDYRGPDGVSRATPMTHAEFVGSRQARQRYWARSYAGWARFGAAAPNVGHAAVARLQRAAVLGTVITQNVDGLHQRAGSMDVVELHGSLAQVVCLTCGTTLPRSDVQEAMSGDNPGFLRSVGASAADGTQVSSQIRPDGDVVLSAGAVADFRTPRCPQCAADTLKPDVVFFGGSVPAGRVELCTALTDVASVVIVLGSSLAVASGLRFVRRAHGHGIPVAIVTRGWCRGDGFATLRLDVPLSPLLEGVAARLG